MIANNTNASENSPHPEHTRRVGVGGKVVLGFSGGLDKLTV